jgi:hypothetical protein
MEMSQSEAKVPLSSVWPIIQLASSGQNSSRNKQISEAI